MPSSGPTLSTAMLEAAVDLIGRDGLRGSVAVAGVSMHPTFGGVQRLAVEFSPTKIAFGDVLVFRQRGNLVVHRLVRKIDGGRRLKTRGDGTVSFDPLLDAGDVIGRVFAVEYTVGDWRSIRGGRAGIYGRLIAAHDLCWGLLGGLAWKVAGDTWQWRVGRLDRFKLGVVHPVLFALFNPTISPPELDADSGGVEAHCYTRSLDRSTHRKKPNQR